MEIDMFLPHLKRNFSALSYREQDILLNSKVFVVGCGGLGGYVVEILGRIGVGEMVIADGDVFDETNLNRQLFSSIENIGKNKAEVARKRLAYIAPHCNTTCICRNLSPEEVVELGIDAQVIVDAIGGSSAKLELILECSKNSLPVVTGAVAGWEGFVSSVPIRGKAPVDFFKANNEEGAENILGCTSPIVSLIGTLQAHEVISYLLWNRFNLSNRVFYISLKDFKFLTFDL